MSLCCDADHDISCQVRNSGKAGKDPHCWATPGKVPQYLFHSAAAFSGDSSRGVVALQAGHFTANVIPILLLDFIHGILWLLTFPFWWIHEQL